jgi:DNA replication protein DnaC
MNERPTETIRITGKCDECGTPVDRSVPVFVGGRFGDLLVKHYREQATGLVPVYCDLHEEDSEERKRAERSAVRRLDSRYNRAGVPQRFREVEWDDFTDVEPGCREALEAVRAFADGDRKMGLCLWGNLGVGKTMMMGTVATVLIRSQIRVRWIDVARLLTDLRGGFNTRPYKRAFAQLDPAEPGEVLMLDDLDKTIATDREVQPLYVAINEWSNAGNPILVTANRHLDHLAEDLGDRYGEPIASRLVGSCIDIEVRGRDRRLDEVGVAA